jgi:hypothetical protein
MSPAATTEKGHPATATKTDHDRDMQPDATAGTGQRRARRRGRVRAQPGAAIPALADGTLKLMLILLAFFVYLHSRSSFTADRVSPILESLAIRFAGTGAEGAAFETTANRLDPSLQLRRRLLGHLPISAAPAEVTGALMAFDLDDRALFEPDAAAVRREQLVLLNRLGRALGRSAAGEAAVLTITTAPPPLSGVLATRRLAALQRVLATAGIDTERLRFGFADLPSGSWRFTIRVDDHRAR